MEGILLVDKPHGCTTHDAVDAARRRTGLRRIGHAGTLDPMATGLVVLLLGPATRLFDEMSGHDKAYDGMLTLGLTTDTQDLEGRITSVHEGPLPDEARVRSVFASFTGTREQRVPRYSAAKVGGRKCCEMARRNVAFKAPIKTVEIRRLDVCLVALPDVYFRAEVSKGTYLRALAEEIGAELGTGAVLSSLRRTRSGPFTLDAALPLAALKGMKRDAIAARLLPPAAVRA